MSNHKLKLRAFIKDNNIDALISFLLYNWKDSRYFIRQIGLDGDVLYTFHDNNGTSVKITEIQFNKLKTKIPRLNYISCDYDNVYYLVADAMMESMFNGSGFKYMENK